MTAPNVLFIMSDQHQQRITGCYGHDFVQTPNLDRLAARGTRFQTAYTNSPICVPSRAVLATGRYVHETGYWDNAHAYEGRLKSWHHMMQENGLSANSIGKLHFRREEDPLGLDDQINPMHILDGIGDVQGCVKRPMPPPLQRSKVAAEIGPGQSTYTKYDRDIMERTCGWLGEKGANGGGAPWALFCSFVCPHPPHIAPREFYDLYPTHSMPEPKLRSPDAPQHPWIHLQERSRNHEDFLTDETRPVLMASYFGCVSYMDYNVGRVLAALEEAGLRDKTIVLYATDHGECLGARRIWGKSNMYEEAAAIPMIVAGPGVPEGKTSVTPVTLADIAPTILDAVGLDEVAKAEQIPGRSMLGLANAADDPDRVAFSEYYAAAADHGTLMVRKGKYKYIHYVEFEPELFDLENDPEELCSLAADPAHRSVLDDYERTLRAIVNPEEIDEKAYQEQTQLVEQHGGREKVIAKGAIQGTPAPGEKADFVS